VCTACTAPKPQHSTFVTNSPACPWVCDNGYWGNDCAACLPNYWCRFGVQNKCPQNSVSVALSTTQSACVCELGYMSSGKATGSSPCILCRAGVLCNGVPVKEVVISAAPLVNVTTQILMAKKSLPSTPSMVTLFTNVPSNLQTIRQALPDASASIYLRQVCRGTYCVACEDSTATCIRSYVVGMDSQTTYTANITSIRRDVLYTFAPATAADCAPRIDGLADEFTSNAMVVISSVASVSSVRVVCATDAAKFVVLPVDAA
jgi:hypothetical protein